MNTAEFTVTRQNRWIDGVRVVEISQGGSDYTNADALSKKYDGEFETFTGMLPAVKKGIEIAQQWQKDQPEEKIFVGIGCTHGMSMPFDEMELTEENITDLLEEAKKHDEKLPKCDRCGDLLPEERHRYRLMPPFEEEEFCSENCADNAYWDYMAELEEDEEEEEELEDEEEE